MTVSPGSKSGIVLAGGELGDLLFFELLDEVHGEFSVGSAQAGRRAIWSGCLGRASFYDKARGFVTPMPGLTA